MKSKKYEEIVKEMSIVGKSNANRTQIGSVPKCTSSYKELIGEIPEENSLTKPEPEIQEEFYAVTNMIKSEDPNIAGKFEAVYVEPTELSDNYKVGSEQSLEFSKLSSEMIGDNPPPSLCRLCATQSKNMIHMLDPSELYKNIIEKIELCLPITVRETDNLPKQACRTCLEKLELCYQFHKSVAEAEKQLLMSGEQVSGKCEETEDYCRASLSRNGQRDAGEKANDTTAPETSSSPQELLREDTIPENNAVASNPKSRSEGLIIPPETHHSDNLDKDAFDSGETSASSDEQGSCYSALNSPMHSEDLEEGLKSNNEVSDSELKVPLMTKSNQASSGPRAESGKDNCNDDIPLCKRELKRQSFSGKEVKCRVCEKSLETAEQCQIHAHVHFSRHSYPCYCCDEILETKRDWNEHCAKHAENIKLRKTGETKSCDQSENTFISKLKEKFYKLGQDSNPKLESISAKHIGIQEDPNADQKKNDRAVECTVCNLKFHPDLLQVHEETCSIQRSKKNNVLSAKVTKNLSCACCGKIFEQERLLLAHIQTHTEKQLDSIHGNHLSNVKIPHRSHTNEEKLEDQSERYSTSKCNICNKRFSPGSETEMQNHQKSCGRMIYKDKFSCPDCKKEFDLGEDLAAHILDHWGERSYSCNVCGEKFKHKAARDEHRKNHMNRNIYKCSICGRTFDRSVRLRYHAKTHREKLPPECRICGRTFSSKLKRDNHVTTHTNERFQCDICGYYLSASYLDRHKKTQHKEIVHKN